MPIAIFSGCMAIGQHALMIFEIVDYFSLNYGKPSSYFPILQILPPNITEYYRLNLFYVILKYLILPGLMTNIT
jgi:hypothetical protein